MIYRNGFPKPTGATDWMDSAMCAGMMALFFYETTDAQRFSTAVYMYRFDSEEISDQAVRATFDDGSGLCPNNPNNFSRDQLICLIAGMANRGNFLSCNRLLKAARKRWYRAQNTERDAPGTTKKFPDGPDLLMPSHMNHLRICAGEKPLILGKIWLIIEIAIHSWFKPLSEPNQLMCMAKVAGPWYVRLMRKLNPNLDQAIMEYWGGWRKEEEFGKFLCERFR